MLAYTVRRLLASMPLLGAVSFVAFWLVTASSDPVQESTAAGSCPKRSSTPSTVGSA